MNKLSFLFLFVLLAGLFQCSPSRVPQKAAPADKTYSPTDIQWPPTFPPPTENKINLKACDYWDGLQRSAGTKQEKVFQLLHGLKFENNGTPELWGYYKAQSLIAVLYLLSGENAAYELRAKKSQTSAEVPLEGRLLTGLESISLKELPQALADFFKAGDLSSWEYMLAMAKLKEWQDLKITNGEARELRNKGFEKIISNKFPGIFQKEPWFYESFEQAHAARVEGSAFIKNLLKILNRESFLWSDQGAVEKLAKPVNIWVSSSWVERKKDLVAMMAALKNEDNSDSEKICKFLIGQKLTSQILDLKGIRAAPKADSLGFLPRFTTYNAYHEGSYPQFDWPSFFVNTASEKSSSSFVATLDWIVSALRSSAPTDYDIRGVTELSEFLQVFDFLTEITANRDPDLWKLYLNPALLKASIGLYGAVGKILATRKLFKGAEFRLFFAPNEHDTPSNWATFLLLTLKRVEIFEGLGHSPSSFEQEILSSEERKLLSSNLRLELSATLVEVRNRIREGRYNKELIQAHDHVADRIENKFLKELTKDLVAEKAQQR